MTERIVLHCYTTRAIMNRIDEALEGFSIKPSRSALIEQAVKDYLDVLEANPKKK